MWFFRIAKTKPTSWTLRIVDCRLQIEDWAEGNTAGSGQLAAGSIGQRVGGWRSGPAGLEVGGKRHSLSLRIVGRIVHAKRG